MWNRVRQANVKLAGFIAIITGLLADFPWITSPFSHLTAKKENKWKCEHF